MRQAGIVAAAGLYALDHHVERLADDHEHARRLAHGLAEAGLPVDLGQVETNFVFVDVGALGFDPDEAQAQGLDLVYASPVELQIDSIIVDMFRRIQQRRIRRVVIDALGDLASAATDPQRLHDYLYALVQHFAVSGITSVLNFETAGNTIAGNSIQNAMSYLSDNVVLLTVDGEERTRRKLRILKTRGSAHDMRIREVEITAAGVNISE